MATAAERLVEAEAAYHALLTGKAAVEIADSNGDRVRYTSANRRDLRDYIADLKAEIAVTSRHGGPLRPIYL